MDVSLQNFWNFHGFSKLAYVFPCIHLGPILQAEGENMVGLYNALKQWLIFPLIVH